VGGASARLNICNSPVESCLRAKCVVSPQNSRDHRDHHIVISSISPASTSHPRTSIAMILCVLRSRNYSIVSSANRTRP
jgi:hypothetical protein